VACSSLVRLGEGERERPPPHGRGQLFAGASRSRSVVSRHSRGLLGSQCRVSFRRAARRESPCCVHLCHARACLTVGLVSSGVYTRRMSRSERGRSCLYRQPLTLGCHGDKPCPFVVCLGVGSRARLFGCVVLIREGTRLLGCKRNESPSGSLVRVHVEHETVESCSG
jgi:hypothetical protein